MATPRRTGLGRGIGALIPVADDATAARPVDVFFPEGRLPGEELLAVPGARLANLSPDDIIPNPQQPRREFRDVKVNAQIPPERFVLKLPKGVQVRTIEVGRESKG